MKPITICLLVCFYTPLSGANSNAQKTLRTLFTTPDERDLLNKLRMKGKFESQKHNESVAKSHKPVMVKMQGVVIRKEQKPVVFVNDLNTLKSQKFNNGVVVKSRTEIKENYIVPVSINDYKIRLKPGQQWSELKKIVKETYMAKKLDTYNLDEK